MSLQNRREFLQSLTLGGAAIFTPGWLDKLAAECALDSPPAVVMADGLSREITLVALEQEGGHFWLGLGASPYVETAPSWRDVLGWERVETIERAHAAGFFDERGHYDINDQIEGDVALEAYESENPGVDIDDPDLELPTWKTWLASRKPRFTEEELHQMEFGRCPHPDTLDEPCDDADLLSCPQSYDDEHNPGGAAYREISELLERIDEDEPRVSEAARACFTLIEGGNPGSDCQYVHVNSRADLGILREIFAAGGWPVEIIIE